MLEHALRAGVKHVVFSSTAAVYGIPSDGEASEETPTAPINAYGTSKLMTEWMLRDVAAVNPLRYVALRYFNVAGSDPKGRIGQSTPKATLLTKVACEVVVGKRPYVSIFGTDYPTPDGTGVRDYIHVEDLADAHLKALAYLRRGGESTTLNCGYGRGYSVRELLAMVENVAGHPIAKKRRTSARRRSTHVGRSRRPYSCHARLAAAARRPRQNRYNVAGMGTKTRCRALALVTIRGALRMKMRRPRTLLGMVLMGLAFVTVPLLVAVGNAMIKLGQLAAESEVVLDDSATATLENQRLANSARAHGAQRAPVLRAARTSSPRRTR